MIYIPSQNGYGHQQYHWMDGDIEVGRINWHEPSKQWVFMLFDKHNIDDLIEGHAPTAALAAYGLEAESRNPSHPITLTNAGI